MNHPLWICTAAAVVIGVASACTPSTDSHQIQRQQAEAKTTPFKVIGYISESERHKNFREALTWQLPYLTHVNYAFINPTDDATGTLQPFNRERLNYTVTAARAEGVEVFLSIGGWRSNEDSFDSVYEKIAADDQARARFIANLLELTREYRLDGIDLDWEYPRLKYANQYADFVEQLARALHAENKKLTAAVIGTRTKITDHGDGAAYLDRVLAAFDWINLMAYDDRPDNHSPRDLVKRSLDYWLGERGVPAEKAVLGLPIYARPSWRSYAEVLAAHPNAACFDSVVHNGVNDYYNGLPTISWKTRQALEMNLAGVMTWELPLDSFTPQTSIMATIKQTIDGSDALLSACIDAERLPGRRD